jgi:hypothetical protein
MNRTKAYVAGMEKLREAMHVCCLHTEIKFKWADHVMGWEKQENHTEISLGSCVF